MTLRAERFHCDDCGTELMPGQRRLTGGLCSPCVAHKAKEARKVLEAKAAAFHANATRYRRRATLQRNPHERAYWDHAAALATKRAEEFEAELKQLGASHDNTT